MNDVKTFLLFTYWLNNAFVFIIRTMIKISILSEIRWLKTFSLCNWVYVTKTSLFMGKMTIYSTEMKVWNISKYSEELIGNRILFLDVNGIMKWFLRNFIQSLIGKVTIYWHSNNNKDMMSKRDYVWLRQQLSTNNSHLSYVTCYTINKIISESCITYYLLLSSFTYWYGIKYFWNQRDNKLYIQILRNFIISFLKSSCSLASLESVVYMTSWFYI